MSNYTVLREDGQPVKAWVDGVAFEDEAKKQLLNISKLPFVYKWLAAMPDVHRGYGATIGSVIPTKGAIIPAAIGVDIGCGMNAVRTTLTANDLPDDTKMLRDAIEKAVPHGRTNNGGPNDRGAWGNPPPEVEAAWMGLEGGYRKIIDKHPKTKHHRECGHLGTLGGGNHFLELCLDEEGYVWFMLHSGSRGVGNRIGTYFMELAKKDMEKFFINLPDKDLAYFPEGTEHFDDYVEAMLWAQGYAKVNREVMMDKAIKAVQSVCKKLRMPKFEATDFAVNCHHNYSNIENHYGENVWITRKGAVRARKNDLSIIPGSMGAKSFIVRGKGNPESFHSCSHGAGRAMSRTEARRRFTLKHHREATEGVECKKSSDVLDETPGAYKDVDSVMAAQSDLVEVVHTLKQFLCVKG